mmetsp:Transcript_20485/g.37249  ORF Transcript_20485/g.37249 Transcript_20485/m.37249 type:complete len:520 (-) Transcript_20485:58-1617(-)
MQYGSVEGTVQRPEQLHNVYVAFCFIASGGLLFGYIIGINSNILLPGQLLCPTDGSVQEGSWTSIGYAQCYTLGPFQIGLLSSLNLIGACVSSLICFKYADDLGRKLEVQIAAALYFTGAIMAGAGPCLWIIYVGFLVYGLGIGFAMHAGPLYIAEIAPASVRGALISAKEFVIVIGIFLGFLIGYAFSGIDTVGWRWMVVLSGGVGLTMGVGMNFIPESPRYLAFQAIRDKSEGPDLIKQASEAMKFFSPGDSLKVEKELENILTETEASMGMGVVSWTDSFNYPLPLIIGCGLVFLQQITGQPSVLYFATNIFRSAGFGESAALSSVGLGLVKLLATVFCVQFVDKYGRRFLLFIGIGMMAISLAVIGSAFLFRECSVPGALSECPLDMVTLPKSWAGLTVFSLALYVSGYQVGFGPINWLIISEIFPLRVRGAAISVATMVNFASNLMMTLTSPVLNDAMGPSKVFFSYFFFAMLSLAFVYHMVPETKGKTLEEIEQMMKSGPSTTPLESARVGGI